MNEILPQFEPPKNVLQFSAVPTVQDIFEANIFEEPLVPIGGDPTPSENAALATALLDYVKRSGLEDFSNLTRFLEANPRSPWNAAILTNLGLEYYRSGRYSKAIEAWRQAWELGKTATATELKGIALANRAVGELAYMYTRLGRVTELVALLKSVEGRVFCGPATERIAGAREGLWNMHNRPEISFRCGPLALHRIMLSSHQDDPQSELIDATASTQKGFSLHQVAELSCRLGLDYQMAFRDKGSAFIIVPAVVHFKLGHFAAMIRREGDRYLLQDPTFKDDVWVTKETLEAEASGYFLVPPGELPEGWRTVKSTEAEAAWGKGFVPNGPDDPGPCDDTSDPCKSCKGMAVARVHLLNVSLNINDEPIGYSPPVGPAVRFTVRYNQRDTVSPSIFKYSNFGNKWTFDWLAYIIDNPSVPQADVIHYMMGGGIRRFTGFYEMGAISDPTTRVGVYAFQKLDQTKLFRKEEEIRRPDGTKEIRIFYEMISPDGSKKIFDHPDVVISGTAEPPSFRRIFLTKLIDPFGNAISLEYDATGGGVRVVAIEDAIGQKSTISYGHPPDGFKITRITDPFGRFATFHYDDSNRLDLITDVMDFTSKFTYKPEESDFISAMETPYGVTKFDNKPRDELSLEGEGRTTRSLKITYPDGDRELVEFRQDKPLGIPVMDPWESVPGDMATRNNYLWTAIHITGTVKAVHRPMVTILGPGSTIGFIARICNPLWASWRASRNHSKAASGTNMPASPIQATLPKLLS
jgi:hypothetical protein